MRSLRPLLTLLLLLGAAVAGPALGQTLTFLLPPTPGLFVLGPARKTVGGPGIEAFERVIAAAGLQSRFLPAVGVRGLADAQRLPHHCATSARSAEREALFRWAGPVGRARLVLYARTDDARELSQLSEVQGARIGAARGSLPASLLRAEGLQVEEVSDEARNVVKLATRQIDFWAANELTASYELRAAGEGTPRVALSFGSVDIFIVCHKATSAALMQRLDEAIKAVAAQGGLKEMGLAVPAH